MKVTQTDLLYLGRVLKKAPVELRKPLADYIFHAVFISRAANREACQPSMHFGDGSFQSACFDLPKAATLSFENLDDIECLRAALSCAEQLVLSPFDTQYIIEH